METIKKGIGVIFKTLIITFLVGYIAGAITVLCVIQEGNNTLKSSTNTELGQTMGGWMSKNTELKVRKEEVDQAMRKLRAIIAKDPKTLAILREYLTK